MKTNDNLLVPALQKFYSALNNLQNFDINNDFFENISYLDNFLSEYRNITFMIQKSLAHTELLVEYEKLRDKYLNNEFAKWFVEKRNEVLKKNPFPLEKKIKITIYNYKVSTILETKVFTAENDNNYETLLDSLKSFLKSYNQIEIHFSTEYIYRETGTNTNLFEKILSGISIMSKFIMELNSIVKDNSGLFNNLFNKIQSMKILHLNEEDLFIDDYVYYANKKKFEKGERLFPMVTLKGENIFIKNMRFNEQDFPITAFDFFKIPWKVKFNFSNQAYNFFIKITLIHLLIYIKQSNRIMPTMIILKDNNTFILDSFDSTIRTTLYRKLNEISSWIDNGANIKAVILIHEMWRYNDLKALNYNYEDRVSNLNPKVLFSTNYLDNECHRDFFHFETDLLKSNEYVEKIISENKDVDFLNDFMLPIKIAFKKKKKD